MIKLLKDWNEHKEGDLIDADEAEEARLINDGTAESIDVVNAVEDAAKRALEVSRKAKIEVVDTPIFSEGVRGLGEYAHDIFVRGRKGNTTPTPRLDLYSEKQSSMLRNERTVYGGTFMSDTGDWGDDLIPDDFVQILKQKMHDYGDIYSRCFHYPTKFNNVLLPCMIETDRSTGAGKRHGGITVVFVEEAYQKTETRMKLEMLDMKLKKLAALVPVTDELLADTPFALGTILMKLMTEACMYVIEHEIIRATTGANFDEGLINSTSTIGVGRSAAGAIAWADICALYMRIHSPLRKNMIWLVSPRAEQELLELESTSGFPIYLNGPSYPTGAAPPPNTLLGKPVFISEHASDLGSTGDIIAANMGEYFLAEKQGGPQLAQSMHLLFDYDMQVFRIVQRINGEPWWGTNTLTLEQGNVEVSWASYLAEGLTDITTF